MKWASPNGYLEKEKKEVAGNGKRKVLNKQWGRKKKGRNKKKRGGLSLRFGNPLSSISKTSREVTPTESLYLK